jgi:hypothetical protein
MVLEASRRGAGVVHLIAYLRVMPDAFDVPGGFMRTALLMTPLLVGSLAAAACGGSTPGTGSAVNPTAPSQSRTLTGVWVGASADSSGSMMGAGLSAAMMDGMSWQIAQTGNTFSGSVRFNGYPGSPMTVTGSLNGRTGTFTVTLPAGSMMMAGCTATASGSFDMDDVMDQIHGDYSGSNTCTGPFDKGQLTLTRQP